MATTTDPAGIDVAQMTRAQRAALPISADVARALAEQHGVCIRPLAMRRIDTTTGRIEECRCPAGPPDKTSVGHVPTRPVGYG